MAGECTNWSLLVIEKNNGYGLTSCVVHDKQATHIGFYPWKIIIMGHGFQFEFSNKIWWIFGEYMTSYAFQCNISIFESKSRAIIPLLKRTDVHMILVSLDYQE